jgi:hypothetical protein
MDAEGHGQNLVTDGGGRSQTSQYVGGAFVQTAHLKVTPLRMRGAFEHVAAERRGTLVTDARGQEHGVPRTNQSRMDAERHDTSMCWAGFSTALALNGALYEWTPIETQ